MEHEKIFKQLEEERQKVFNHKDIKKKRIQIRYFWPSSLAIQKDDIPSHVDIKCSAELEQTLISSIMNAYKHRKPKHEETNNANVLFTVDETNEEAKERCEVQFERQKTKRITFLMSKITQLDAIQETE